MVKAPYFDSNGMKKGAWNEEEDFKLKTFIHNYGHKNWRLVPIYAGLKRCGKSCRLRWVNYLKPDLKRGEFATRDRELIVELHSQFGSRWSTISSYFPGRTDNDLKNYWNGHIEKPNKRSKKAINKQRTPQDQKSSSSLSTNDHSNSKSSSDNLKDSSSKNVIYSEENLSTELSSQTSDDAHIIISDNHWDPCGELSEAFDFEMICQDTTETNKSNSSIDLTNVSSTNQLSASDASSSSSGEFDGNFWSGSFWKGTSYINEPRVYVSSEEEYDLLSYGFPEFWDSMNLFD